MRILLWVSLATIFYTYFGYPLAAWFAARLRPRFWKAGPMTPGLSIIMPVHNAVAHLPWKLQHLSTLDYPHINEIIVISDGSTDGTAEYLRNHEGGRLKVVILERHCGKAAALNAGMAQASSEVLLFIDIRPELAPGALQYLVSNFQDPRVGCVTGNLVLHTHGHDGTAEAVGGFYWRYEQWLRNCESLSDSTVGVYGGFYAVRRELAVRQPDGLILDDMFQPLSIIRQGYRCVVDTRATVMDTWPQRHHQEFQRKVRTLAGNFQLAQCAPWILSRQNRALLQLVSHKVLRLLVPYFFILLLLSTLFDAPHSVFCAVLSGLQIAGWSIAVVALYRRIPFVSRFASAASAVLLLNAAAVVGLYRFLFSPPPLWRIWMPAGRSGGD